MPFFIPITDPAWPMLTSLETYLTNFSGGRFWVPPPLHPTLVGRFRVGSKTDPARPVDSPRSSAVAWQAHQPSPQTQEIKGHRLGRKERACTQAMPSLKNVESTSPNTNVSFTLQKLNSYQNVQQNQTNVEVMANAWRPESNGFKRKWSMHIEPRHHLPIPSQYKEVGHRSGVWEGVVWRWGEGGSLFLGSRSNLFGDKCPTRMTSHLKGVNLSWNH